MAQLKLENVAMSRDELIQPRREGYVSLMSQGRSESVAASKDAKTMPRREESAPLMARRQVQRGGVCITHGAKVVV